MHKIDLDTWPRRELLKSYFATDFPYVAITAEVDVANLYRFAKAQGISFYFAMVWLANRTADSIENFRYRVDADGQPWLIDANRPIFTHMQQGAELFCLIQAPPCDSILTFCQQAAVCAQQPLENNGWDSIRNQNDTIIYTSLPWVRFTQITRTVTRAGYDCAPRVSWGKFVREGDKIMMPVALQVFHGLMDGYHLGLYYQRLQQALDDQSWL